MISFASKIERRKIFSLIAFFVFGMALFGWPKQSQAANDACAQDAPAICFESINGSPADKYKHIKLIPYADYIANGCPQDFLTYTGCLKTPNVVCCQNTPTSEGNSAGDNTNASCLPEPAQECGKKAADGAPDDKFSYKCWQQGVVQPGAVKVPISELLYKSCSGTGEECYQMPRCVAPASSTATKPPTEYILSNPLGTVSIPVLLGRMIKTFLGIVGGLALLVFVYGGIMWMTARGDTAQLKKGQEALTTAAIGLFIVMFAYTIAGNFVSFLTSEQRDIAAEEGRTNVEAPTVADQQVTSLSAQKAAAEEDAKAGQQSAETAGAASGVATPPAGGCSSQSLSESQKKSCQAWICSSFPSQQDQATCLQAYAQGTGQNVCDLYKTQQERDACRAAEAINAAQNFVGSGQALYNTPDYESGKTGGQADCKYAVDPDKCSTVGWKTVCNETVFDTGYGSYNDAKCIAPTSCQPDSILSGDCVALVGMLIGIPGADSIIDNCVKLPITSFGTKCGTGQVCCQPK